MGSFETKKGVEHKIPEYSDINQHTDGIWGGTIPQFITQWEFTAQLFIAWNLHGD